MKLDYPQSARRYIEINSLEVVRVIKRKSDVFIHTTNLNAKSVKLKLSDDELFVKSKGKWVNAIVWTEK